jgi:putative PIN family toxin of toxin-antitoxin system
MRVVLDCNVLVSAARTRGTCADVVIETIRHHDLVVSGPILREYRAVAERFAHSAYREGLLSVIEELERIAVFVEPADLLFGLRDGDDEVYLQTATTGSALLITGNRRDFTENRYGSVNVVSPREFLDQARWR